MMLRSSSMPVLGSLLTSFGESPSNNNNNNHHQPEVLSTKPLPSHFHHNYNYCYSKISYSKDSGSQNLASSTSCNSSPSIVDYSYGSGSRFGRRIQSEGNLEALVTDSIDVDEFISTSSKISAHHSHFSSNLESIPSFSFHNSNARRYEEKDSEEEEDDDDDDDEIEEQTITAGNEIESTTATNLSGDSICSGGSLDNNVGLKTEQKRCSDVGFEEVMYLAKGLGIGDINYVCNGNHGGGSGGRGGGEGCKPVSYDGDGGDNNNNNNVSIEQHYRRLIDENPSNPLYLRNYAQFLYRRKKDVQTADEYYSRAILTDPKDGEIQSQYANLIWETYRDKDRATNYYERAVKASPEDSHVHAAYASFLWEIEDEDEMEDSAAADDALALPPLVQDGITA